MLYKTFQSDYDQYLPACPTYSIGWNLCLVQPPREYGATYNATPGCTGDHPIWGIWTDDTKSRGGEEETDVNAIYVLGRTAVAGAIRGHCPGIPSVGIYGQWSVHIAKFDGSTGRFIWADHTVYPAVDFDFLWRDFYFADDQGRLWAHLGYGSYQVMRFRQFDTSCPSSQINDKGRSLGMPALASGYCDSQLDMVIPDSSYLNFAGDGSAFASGTGYRRNTVLNVSVPGNWIAMGYNGSQASADVTDPQIAKSAHVVYVHDLTTKRRLGYVRTRGRPYKGASVDATTLYVFTGQGTVEVINVQSFTNLGILYYQDFTGSQNSWYFGSDLAVCMDKNFRRLLTFQRRPDEEVTGRCQMYVEGWAPIEVAERVMSPIPLEVPQEGKTIKVLTRSYGWGGWGTGGVPLSASITAGDGSVSETATSGNNGYATLFWTCGSEGVNSETIQVSAEVEQSAPGLNDPETAPTIYPPPRSVSNLSQEDLFFPGYWIWLPNSQKGTGTVSAAIDGYLDDYDDGSVETRRMMFQGAIVEYTWAEIETSLNNYNTSKILTDVNYLASQGLKTIVAIRSSGSVQSGFQIPSYITGGEPTVYGEGFTCTAYGADAGVFRGHYETTSDDSDDRCIARLDNISVKGRYSALISAVNAEFVSNDDMVGIIPFDSAFFRDYTDLRPASVSASSWWAARREILETAKATGKLVFDWCGHDNEDQRFDYSGFNTHTTWCRDNEVGLMRPMYLFDNHQRNGWQALRYGTWSATSAVPTGVVLPSSTFSGTHSLDCETPQAAATFSKILNGSANSDQTCIRTGVETYPAWMVAVQLSAGVWDVDEESIMDVIDTQRLALEAKYNR